MKNEARRPLVREEQDALSKLPRFSFSQKEAARSYEESKQDIAFGINSFEKLVSEAQRRFSKINNEDD